MTCQYEVMALDDPLADFMKASVWHGTLERSESILAAHPEIAGGGIHVAAVLGDDAEVQRRLTLDAASATSKGGPHGWDALTYLCFSKYLRLDPARSEGFLRAARALLDAGANAKTGFFEKDHQPNPEFESVIYAAAGVAQHAELTKLLLERGANPNDEETPYHAPETKDNATLRVLVESGKLNQDSLATMLLRKADWHDLEGIKYLLENGADPNRMTRWHHMALHQALRRDNALANIEVLLEHGADPLLANQVDGRNAVGMAARRGRGDVLALFEKRGIPTDLSGIDGLIAACARHDEERVQSIAMNQPHLVDELIGQGGTLLAEFAGVGNTEGVGLLLNLGVSPAALYIHGDGYFGIAYGSTALHVAAWRASHSTVKLLIERGSPVNALDGKGRTALSLAVKACVDSYWQYRRSPESVAALLSAGAKISGVPFPSGYAEVDDLLRPLQ